jgi:hydroxyacyl-ACP dehydratase HTD2-like protein with hotdog domain
MFGEQSIEFHRPLYVNEEVEISAMINDVYEKSGRQKFDVVELAFKIKGDRDGQLVMTGKQSYILFK